MAKFTHTTILSAAAIFATLSHTHAADKLCDICCVSATDSGCVIVTPELKERLDLDLSRTGENPMNRTAAVARAAGILYLMAMVNQATSPGPVVIIGDSIPAGLAGSLPRNFVDLAVGGFTTSQILASEVPRIPANASVVFVEGGLNDAALGITNTTANYRQILAEIPAGASIKLLGVLPVNEAMIAQAHPSLAPFDTNANAAAINSAIKPLCTGRCSVVPSPFPTPLPAGVTVDGIHFNPKGLQQFAGALH